MQITDIPHQLPSIHSLEQSIERIREMDSPLSDEATSELIKSKVFLTHIQTPYKVGSEVVYKGRRYIVYSYAIRDSGYGRVRHTLCNIRTNGEIGKRYKELRSYEMKHVQLIKEGTL